MADALIVSDPQVMMGKPVVVGTRITVELILEKPAAGESIAMLLESYPRLTHAGIRAALLYGAQLARRQAGFPAPIDPDVAEEAVAEYPLPRHDTIAGKYVSCP